MLSDFSHRANFFNVYISVVAIISNTLIFNKVPFTWNNNDAKIFFITLLKSPSSCFARKRETRALTECQTY